MDKTISEQTSNWWLKILFDLHSVFELFCGFEILEKFIV